MRESTLGRSLWLAVLLATVAFAAFSLLRSPGSGRGVTLAQNLTFWVVDAQADTTGDTVANQISGYWPLKTGASTVGLLTGGPSKAISSFFDNTRAPSTARGNLLLVTSTTLSSLERNPKSSASVNGELEQAPLVAVVASDPLELAVRRNSTIRSAAQMIAMVQADPNRQVSAVADDPWLLDNLAGLVTALGLKTRIPTTDYQSLPDAVDALVSGDRDAVLAPRSALSHALKRHQVRMLPWPGKRPQAWVAVAAPKGLSAAQVHDLQRQAAGLARQPQWRELLRSDGLTPTTLSVSQFGRFLHAQAAHTQALARLASRVILN